MSVTIIDLRKAESKDFLEALKISLEKGRWKGGKDVMKAFFSNQNYGQYPIPIGCSLHNLTPIRDGVEGALSSLGIETQDIHKHRAGITFDLSMESYNRMIEALDGPDKNGLDKDAISKMIRERQENYNEFLAFTFKKIRGAMNDQNWTEHNGEHKLTVRCKEPVEDPAYSMEHPLFFSDLLEQALVMLDVEGKIGFSRGPNNISLDEENRNKLLSAASRIDQIIEEIPPPTPISRTARIGIRLRSAIGGHSTSDGAVR